MKLSKKEIGKIAKDFLDFLDRERIFSTKDLEQRLDKNFLIDEKIKSSVSISLNSSEFYTKAYTISYIRKGLGIPLEVKVNLVLEYSRIIIKCEEKIKSYTPFVLDSFGNMVQSTLIESADFLNVREELKRFV